MGQTSFSLRSDIATLSDKVDAVETKINTINSTVNAIILKTNKIPQKVRGTLYKDSLFTSSSDFQNVVSVSGQGKLLMLCCLLMFDTDTLQLILTLDDYAFAPFSHTGDTSEQFLLPSLEIAYVEPRLRSITTPLTDLNLFDFEFKTSLLLQIRRSDGTGGDVKCAALYQLDEF